MTTGRNTAFTWLAPAILTAALCGPAAAESKASGQRWIPQEQVVQKLAATGYTNVNKIKADDDLWEGIAVKEGRIVELRVDPRSGIISEKTIDD